MGLLPTSCLIPAAGVGLRARPETQVTPKALLQVGGKSIIQHNIDLVRNQLGITTFSIVIGHLGYMIQEHLGDGSRQGVTIEYIQNDAIHRGLAWSIYLGNKIKTPFLVVLGDEYYRGSNHHRLDNYGSNDDLAVCGIIYELSSNLIRQNYSVRLQAGRIISIQEKPRRVMHPFMGTGTFILSPEIFAKMAPYFEDNHRRVDFLPILDDLCRAGCSIVPFMLTGEYVNINNQEALKRARHLRNEKR